MSTPPPRPVALITGAPRRIGAAIARTPARAPATTSPCTTAIRAARSRRWPRELEAARAGSTLVLQADLAEFDRLPELVAHTVGRFGRLDALVNNASTFTPTPLGTTTPAQWDALFASNARAPFFLAQAAAPHLRATRGAIVNLTDIYAERPLRGHAIYCMAKAALVMMTKSLALELAPGRARQRGRAGRDPVAGERRADAQRRSAMLGAHAAGAHRHAEEIAEAVRWLLVDATYSTGQILRIDGGRMLEG